MAAAALALFAASWAADPTKAEAAGPDELAADGNSNPKLVLSCGDLRRSLDAMSDVDQSKIELSVSGALSMVEFDGALAYLGTCEPPAPRVLCIAYGTNGLDIGDVVVLSGGLGGYSRPDTNHILLNPCLPSPPGR
jgi:hypothetical protein